MKEQKAALRREIRARIAALPEEYLRESDAGVLENVLSLPEFCRAGAVFAYLSVERECDTRRIIDALMESERAVALPRSRPGGSMDFALYDGRLAEGLYGIPQPPEDVRWYPSKTVRPSCSSNGSKCPIREIRNSPSRLHRKWLRMFICISAYCSLMRRQSMICRSVCTALLRYL